jgi:hypothetical protein
LHPLARVVVERSHAVRHAAHPKGSRALADGLMLVFRGTAAVLFNFPRR